jgi:hypothetical protein
MGLAAVGLAVSMVAVIPVLQTSAVASGGGPGQNLSAASSPMYQTNGTVWSLAYSNGVVYAGGAFTSVRPPGEPLGTDENPRTYLAAFNSATGALLSFAPTINGTVKTVAVSADGTTLYVGGSFTEVDGAYHDDLAAINIATGNVVSNWKPSAPGYVDTIAPAANGSAIYFGGGFSKADGVARTDAAAVAPVGATSPGSLLAWDPVLNGSVTSIAVDSQVTRVIIGGYFTTFNGAVQQAIGSTDPTTGAIDPFAATIVPNYPGCLSDVKDVIISDASGTPTVYVAAEGTGGGCYDGDFAATVSTGTLVWQNDCLGATQTIEIVNGWLYKGSHAHDCAYAPSGFPQVNNSGGWVTHHLLDQSLVDGSLGHWTPDTNAPGGVEPLGPGDMTTDGTQLFVGGDFTTVNGKTQQGLTRFAPGPDTTTPGKPTAPTVTSTQAKVVTVTFNAVSDSDDGTLTYYIYRHGTTAPIGSLQATSWPWALPVLHYNDTGLTAGKSYTYQVTASDGTNTSAKSTASASVTVSATSPTQGYAADVLGDNPSFFWPLNDASGSTTAQDLSPNAFTGTYESSGVDPGAVAPGPLAGAADTVPSFDGVSGLVSSTNAVAGPSAFTIEGWFKTTTNTGGKLIGFGNNQTGWSSNYDRHIYMMNDGQLVFGVWNNQTETIESTNAYNDGQWHYVVATLDPVAGMTMWVDGQLVGNNPNTTPQSYTGYWRIGGDNLGAWNLDPWGGNSQGTTQPNSYYFNGDIADVAVYPYALDPTQIATHYAAANTPGINP